jgi:glycosyltransferase involved in cell wall biosynthesis
MAHRIKDVIGTEQIDFVIACEYIMGSYSDYFRNCSAILDDLELGYFYPANDHSNLDWINIRKGLTWIKHRNYISHLLDKFHACTVVSNPEKQLFEKNISNSKHVWVVPNCVNLSDYQDDRLNTVALRNTMIFTGSFGYRPNYEAMIWFIEKVYPLVQSEIPDVHLMITGDHAGKPLPVANNITFTGYVDNIRPLIAQSWISLAPIWTGGGTRLKILEAMALGTPVVSTSKGAEGLDVLHGHDILIDDTSEGFAKSVIRLLQDPDLRSKLTINAYQLVSQKYDWQVEIPEYIRLIQSVLVS